MAARYSTCFRLVGLTRTTEYLHAQQVIVFHGSQIFHLPQAGRPHSHHRTPVCTISDRLPWQPGIPPASGRPHSHHRIPACPISDHIPWQPGILPASGWSASLAPQNTCMNNKRSSSKYSTCFRMVGFTRTTEYLHAQ
jgi:hypothetical protein